MLDRRKLRMHFGTHCAAGSWSTTAERTRPGDSARPGTRTLAHVSHALVRAGDLPGCVGRLIVDDDLITRPRLGKDAVQRIAENDAELKAGTATVMRQEGHE